MFYVPSTYYLLEIANFTRSVFYGEPKLVPFTFVFFSVKWCVAEFRRGGKKCPKFTFFDEIFIFRNSARVKFFEKKKINDIILLGWRGFTTNFHILRYR